MTSTAHSLFQWLSAFGWPVYQANDVPADAELPYITCSVSEPEHDQKASFYIQCWDRSKSNSSVLAKADEIVREIGVGLRVRQDGGWLVLWPESPLVQLMPDGDVRSAYINLSINAYHCPGT
jgi:hypothetical protein